MANKVKTALLLGVCVNWLCWAFFIFGKTVKNEDATPLFFLCFSLKDNPKFTGQKKQQLFLVRVKRHVGRFHPYCSVSGNRDCIFLWIIACPSPFRSLHFQPLFMSTTGLPLPETTNAGGEILKCIGQVSSSAIFLKSKIAAELLLN